MPGVSICLLQKQDLLYLRRRGIETKIVSTTPSVNSDGPPPSLQLPRLKLNSNRFQLREDEPQDPFELRYSGCVRPGTTQRIHPLPNSPEAQLKDGARPARG